MRKSLLREAFLSAAVLFCVAAALPVFADVSFENPDINLSNDILFTVHHNLPGSDSYRTAFLSNAAETSKTEILTCYPEKMELISNGAVLQIRNRYGTAHYSVSDHSLCWIKSASQIPCESVRQGPESPSPDGRWICFVRKTDTATGALILRNTATLSETILNAHADFNYDTVPVKWAPDSSAVIYENNGSIYFCDPHAAFEQVQMTEQFRRIGWGCLNSVSWAGDKTLIYIDRDMIYRIDSNELFTRGLYAPFVGTGTPCGRLPVSFDPLRDHFWVNRDVSSLLVVQSDSIVSKYVLPKSGFSYVQSVYSSPVNDIRGTVLGYDVFWDQTNSAVLWITMLGFENGGRRCSVYRVSSDLKLIMSMGDTGKPVLSPNGQKVAFGAGNSFYVYDVTSWKLLSRLGGEKPVSYVWSGNDLLYAGGSSSVRAWNVTNGADAPVLLFLSAVKSVFWGDNTSAVYAQDAVSDSRFYQYDSKLHTWAVIDPAPVVIPPSVQNGYYRVFTGATSNERYSNALYVRTLAGKPVTKALFPETAVKTGPRLRAALIFDAVDCDDGLSRILDVLHEYGVPATFFINGEFIRRYPAETKQIASAGFECASLFFTSADLTAKGFVVDESFIRRGLARNEDEFYQATGSELSLIWHAPLYHVTPLMKKAGAEAGYTYIDAENMSFDTETLEDAAAGIGSYQSAGSIIGSCTEKLYDGVIIPVSVGIAHGTRSDYLYEKLDLLISSLLDRGYEIVPVRTITR